MMSIFSNMEEDSIEVFMDDFSIVGDSIDLCLINLEKHLNGVKSAIFYSIGINPILWKKSGSFFIIGFLKKILRLIKR